MKSQSKIKFFNNLTSDHLLWLGLVTAFCIIFFLQKPIFYLSDDLDLYLGIIFAPYILRIVSNQKGYRFAFPALLFFIVLFFWKSNSLYFFAFGFTILFLISSSFGKLNNLPILLLIASSGLFRVVANIWTFPIRLKMTELTAKALSVIGFQAEASGNTIFFNEQSFSVAPACMGLDTLATAFILALMVMAFFERKHQYTTGFFTASIWIGIALSLAILSNFIRLAGLVLFQVPAEVFAHDLIGLVSLVVYMLIPFFFLIKYFYKKKNQNVAEHFPEKKSLFANFSFSKNKKYISVYILLLFLTWQSGNQFSNPLQLQQDASFEKITLNGFEKSIDKKGVLKLENDSLLIYIKPPSNIFQGTHDPRYCWAGSGYKLSNIRKVNFGETEIYSAILSEGKNELHTAWWLDNGKQKTIGEFDWRWNTLRHDEGFRLINITSQDVSILENAVAELIQIPFFNKK